MASMNVSSNNVKVFPSGFRGIGYGRSKVTSEENLTEMKILSKHADNNNFVIADPNNTDSYIIGLGGYLFKLNSSAISEISTYFADIEDKTIYAFIKTADIDAERDDNRVQVSGHVLCSAITEEIKQLDNNLEDSTFFGIAFTNDLEETLLTNLALRRYYIQLTDENGQVITTSLRLSTDEIRNGDTSDAIDVKFTTDEIVTDIISNASSNTQVNKAIIKGTSNSVELISSESSTKKLTVTGTASIGGSVEIGSNIKIEGGSTGISTLQLPDNATIKLPANNTANTAALIQDASGNPSWLSVDSNDTENTIVKRDGHNINSEKLNNIKIEHIRDDSKATDTSHAYNTYLKITSPSDAQIFRMFTKDNTTTQMELRADGIWHAHSGGLPESTKIEIHPPFISNRPVHIQGPFAVNSNIELGSTITNVVPIKIKTNEVKDGDADTGSASLYLSKGTLNLPANFSGIDSVNHALTQKLIGSNVVNEWVKMSATAGTPNAIVMTDSQGRINATVQGVIDSASAVTHQQSEGSENSVEYRLLGQKIASAPTPIGRTEPVNVIVGRTPSGGSEYPFIANPYTGNLSIHTLNYVKVNSDTDGSYSTIKLESSTLGDSTKASANIKRDLIINSKTTIGDATNSGEVKIHSAGTSSTTIIGPNNGTATLISDYDGSGTCVLTHSNNSPSWLEYTDSDTSKTIAYRNDNGETQFKNITLTGLSSISGSGDTNANTSDKGSIFLDKDNKLKYIDLKVDTATSLESTATKFVCDVTQDKYGKISVKKAEVTPYTAGNGLTLTGKSFGVNLKNTTKNASACAKSTSTYGGLYAVEMDKDGALAVRVPWNAIPYNSSLDFLGSDGNIKVKMKLNSSNVLEISGNVKFTGSVTVPD